MFPWSKDTLPTAKDVLALFRINPGMLEDTVVKEDDEEEDSNTSWNIITSYSDDVTKAHTFFSWLGKLFSPVIQIGIGGDEMKPVPYFILAKLAPGWVGGVLTSLVCP